MKRSTVILGQRYAGRPMFGSLACQLHLLQRRGCHQKARDLLAAHNQIRRAFGQPPVDLAAQMTPLPLEGVTIMPAGRRDDDFDDGPKECPSCGERLQDGRCEVGCQPERLIDRVVIRTARAA